MVNCHQDVARVLQGEERQELRHLMDRYNKSIQVKAQQNYHREQFEVYGRPAQQSDRPVGAGTPQSGRQERPWARDRRPSGDGAIERGHEGTGAEERAGTDRSGRAERGGSSGAALPGTPSTSEPSARKNGGSE